MSQIWGFFGGGFWIFFLHYSSFNSFMGSEPPKYLGHIYFFDHQIFWWFGSHERVNWFICKVKFLNLGLKFPIFWQSTHVPWRSMVFEGEINWQLIPSLTLSKYVAFFPLRFHEIFSYLLFHLRWNCLLKYIVKL